MARVRHRKGKSASCCKARVTVRRQPGNFRSSAFNYNNRVCGCNGRQSPCNFNARSCLTCNPLACPFNYGWDYINDGYSL